MPPAYPAEVQEIVEKLKLVDLSDSSYSDLGSNIKSLLDIFDRGSMSVPQLRELVIHLLRNRGQLQYNGDSISLIHAAAAVELLNGIAMKLF